MQASAINPVTRKRACSTGSSGGTWMTSLRAAADRADGAGLPEFVAREFREFLTCEVLAPTAVPGCAASVVH